MMPSCDQIGVPIHFHSSTTSGSASLMSLRILLRVSPRQSPSSAILFEISSDADGPWLAPDFFMFSSFLSSAGPAPERRCSPRGQALAGVACTRRQKKYESPKSTPVAHRRAPRLRAIAHREVGDEAEPR